ncbi:sodium:solute symporter [Fulvivirga sediminis]|uniref:Sodium:solute symporter n=1 Tax=Fulvivirga sediminis TaxID=2803949 RepID=A0A937K125_9BACT|nr:sodium:solute symporter [Fulvivirga sediminis]MBL3656890.1 sodium:solute symporter [Fulvivirga sediminis]
MTPTLVLSVIAIYFAVLILISFITGKNTDSKTFFTANRQSPWYLVAFGMIGASLSGVTFVSIPGWVASTQFGYMQVVLGYLVGYLVIGTILMPLYYKLNLTSIYEYLEQRFGFWSYKTGAFYFIFSRIIGSSFRLFLVSGVLQFAVFRQLGVDFSVTVLVTIALIWIYTFRSGIKTIVWTDTLQTLFMITAVITVIYLISQDLNLSVNGMISAVKSSEYSKVLFWDWKSSNNFFKQFISGAFIAIVMTGLDQDMMQKNLTCKTIGEAQKNMFWFSIILVFVNLLFLTMGALLYMYAGANGIAIPEKSDDLFPLLALNHFTLFAGVVFLLGIIAAAYSSADSALTALTTSFCVDFLNFNPQDDSPETQKKQKKTRLMVHLSFSFILFLVIIIFKEINNEAVISSVFKAAGYTYGPLLGLYSFGLFTKLEIKDKWVPVVCIISPVLSLLINNYSEKLLKGYEFGFEILILNGAFTFVGLLMLVKKKSRP